MITTTAGPGDPGPAVRVAIGRLPSELHDVLGRRTLLALHDVELDPLSLGQRLEPLTLNRRVVDEAVLLAAFGRDEAEALGVIEPLDRAGGAHCSYSLCAVIGAGDAAPPDYAICVIWPSRQAAADRQQMQKGSQRQLRQLPVNCPWILATLLCRRGRSACKVHGVVEFRNPSHRLDRRRGPS